MRNREIDVLRMILLACEDTSVTHPTSRKTLIRLACQYGKSYKIKPLEVENVLLRSVQCIVFPKEEWG